MEIEELEPIDEELYHYIPDRDTFSACHASLTVIPQFNKRLIKKIRLYKCTLEDVSGLQEGLVNLSIWHTPIQYIYYLPSTLVDIELYDCNLTELPELPESITTLRCHRNFLTRLNMLPPFLVILECSSNQLTELPPLPHTLEHLLCSFNQLTSLPRLPKKINCLCCSSNPLASLPYLPSSMEYLSCSHTQLTVLPDLPESLMDISCDDNLYPSERWNEEGECGYPYCEIVDDDDPYCEPDQHIYCLKKIVECKRIQQRCKIIKEEIMMKAWHPSRMMRLIEMGMDVEDM